MALSSFCSLFNWKCLQMSLMKTSWRTRNWTHPPFCHLLRQIVTIWRLLSVILSNCSRKELTRTARKCWVFGLGCAAALKLPTVKYHCDVCGKYFQVFSFQFATKMLLSLGLRECFSDFLSSAERKVREKVLWENEKYFSDMLVLRLSGMLFCKHIFFGVCFFFQQKKRSISFSFYLQKSDKWSARKKTPETQWKRSESL